MEQTAVPDPEEVSVLTKRQEEQMVPRAQSEGSVMGSSSLPAGWGDYGREMKKCVLRYSVRPPALLPPKAQIRPTTHKSLNTSSREVHAFELTSSVPTG